MRIQDNVGNKSLVVIVFCYLFRFILFKGTILQNILDSSSLVFIYLVLQTVVNDQYIKYIQKALKNWYVQKILIMYCGILVVSLFICFKEFLYSYLDIGFIKTWILLGIQIIVGIFVFAYIEMKGGNVFTILINAYIVQACIQLISFISSPIWHLLNLFRTDSVISVSGTIRGMSLDRYDYFNLSCGYCLIYILLAFRWDKWEVSSYWKKVVGLALLIYGGLASARTSMVAMLISIVACIMKRSLCKRCKIRLKKIGTISFVIIFISIVIYNLLQSYGPAQFMFNYLFIHIINYLKYSKFTNPSTKQLFGEMYFSIQNPVTWLIGDGHFLNEQGGYYKYTDAGYMRMILYGGLVISVLLFIFQLMFLDNKLKNKENKLEKFFVYFTILILNIKGIVIGCQVLLIPMLFLVFLSDRNRNKIGMLIKGKIYG